MSQDRSAECKCGCHTGELIHCVQCSCYDGNPIVDDAPQEFAMGANMPPEIAWQEDRTVGEIALILCLLRCDEELRQVPVLEDKELRSEIDAVLRMYDIDKYSIRR